MDLNWRALRVTGEVRSAIYDEQFPVALRGAMRLLPAGLADAFDQERALAVLATFAASWAELRPDRSGRTEFIGLRRDPLSRVEAILVFYAIELSSQQIVITEVDCLRLE